MLRRPITYKDYNDNDKTDILYFNLTKFEWLELEAYTKGGLIENLQHSIEVGNTKKTIDILKKIILRAYGEKDPETGTFEKSDDIAIRFSKTEAFSELFMELAYDANKSEQFFLGLVPSDVREEALARMEEMKKEGVVETAIVDINTHEVWIDTHTK